MQAVPALDVRDVAKSFPVYSGGGNVLRAVRSFRKRIPILRGITMSVRKGELFGLLGPNGAGKTTLLKMLATLSLPDAGVIEICGLNVVERPLQAKRMIGLCTSEDRSFYFRLTARENMEFFGALSGLRGAHLRRRIDEVVEQVDLGSSIDKRFDAYSSGMRQRLTIARALLSDPQVVLLDEPTRAVDPVHAEAIRRLIRDDLVNRCGKTVILATNILEEAWRLCDRVAVIAGGTIVAQGPPDELDGLRNQVVRYRAVFDRVDNDLIERTRNLPGVTHFDIRPTAEGVNMIVEMEPSERALTDLLRALSSNGVIVREFAAVKREPVDTFLHITRSGS